MPIHPTPPERIQQVQDALRAQFFGAGAEPPLSNTDTAAHLGRVTHLEYRGRLYTVPPVPYPAGSQLNKLMQELRAASRARDWDQVERMHDRAAALFQRLVRPTTFWRRLWWPLVRNPFRDASEEEIGELFLFFSACRTKSTVRPHSASAPGSRAR